MKPKYPPPEQMPTKQTPSKGITYVPVDFETTGLEPIDHELLSFVAGEYSVIQGKGRDELFVLETFADSMKNYNRNTTTILTYNGGTRYKRGFDLPWLRTKSVINGIPWALSGYNHIDLFPLITNMFNLDFNDYKLLKDLDVDELKKMIKHFGCTPGKKKDEHVSIIREFVSEDDIGKYLKEHVDKKVKPHNGLKDACLHLLKIEDFGVDGKMVPGIFQKWKETGDDSILKTILEYNKDDCDKTMALFEIVREYVNAGDISGELL